MEREWERTVGSEVKELDVESWGSIELSVTTRSRIYLQERTAVVRQWRK